MINRLSRWAPLAGVLFTLLFASLFFTPTTPDVDASTSKIISFYASHRGALQAQAYLIALSGLFLVVFMAVLTEAMRRRGAEVLSRVAFAGSVMIAVGFSLGAATNLMLTHKSVTYDATTAKVLNIVSNDSFFVTIAVGLSLMMLATGIAVLGTKVLPTWMGWVAIVAGVGAVAGWIAWFALMLTGLWSVVAAVMTYRRMSAEAAPTISLPDAGAAQVPVQGQPQESESNTRIIR